MKFECCDNKPVVSCKELGTPVNPSVLDDATTRTTEDVIDLLSYPSGITKSRGGVFERSLPDAATIMVTCS